MAFQEEFMSSCGSGCRADIYGHTNLPLFGIHNKKHAYRWDMRANKSDMCVPSLLMQDFTGEALEF